MWSTELQNGFNIVKLATTKGPSRIVENFQDKSDCIRSVYKDDTIDVLDRIKASDAEYIGNLPYNTKCGERPFKTTKGKKHSTRHFTDEFLWKNKPDDIVKHHEGQSIRTVEITRTTRDPLGFFIRQGDGISNKLGIFVSRISRGSLVDCSGVLKVGDEILEVNHIDVRGFSLSDIVKLIQAPKCLILTVRISRLPQLRPKLSSRHSSPSLLSGQEQDCKIVHKSNIKAKQSIVDRFNQMTENNEQKYKQRDEYSDRLNANESYSDLSKNTSTTDDRIWLLRTQIQDQKDMTYEAEDEKPLVNVSKYESGNVLSSVYAKPKPHNVDKLVSDNSQSQMQTNEKSLNHPQKQASTIIPTTTVNLVFDDGEAETVEFTKTAPQANTNHSTKSHPYHRIQINKPQVNLTEIATKEKIKEVKVDTLKVNLPRSRPSSRGSSPGGSPKTRRKLPSVPVEAEPLRRKQLANETNALKKHLLIPGSAVYRPHRKLPAPPVSPIMGYEGHPSEPKTSDFIGSPLDSTQKEKNRCQKAFSCSGLESSEMETKESSKKLSNNKNSGGASSSKEVHDLTKDHNAEDKLEVRNDKKTQDKGKTGATAAKPTPYRRSQSQYSDFFEQQRHSMFLQFYAFGSSDPSPGSTRNATNNNDCSTESNDIPSIAVDLSKTFPRSRVYSEVVPKRPVLEKNKESFKSTSGRSPGAMRRHASSSLLFSKKLSNESAASQDMVNNCRIKVESQPGFLLYPDDYKDDDLSCSHAVSGMMQVRVIKATNLSFADKKRSKKIYCTIEVDFERKAFTSTKKSTKNPNWDEAFEIEIQHGREMTLMCSSSNKEFDKPVGRASFYLTPLVRRGQTHQMIIRLKPEGLLYAELEFTELKTLLKRAPSEKHTGVFGFNLSVTSELERSSIPLIVRKCVEEIEKRGIHTVGLYRISGNARRKQQLRSQFDVNSTTVDLTATNCPDVNVITGILKDYLRELPEPLITDKMSQELILGVQDNIQDKDTEIEKMFLSKLFSELPDNNRNTLVYILNHLCRVINNENNKMDCRSLSVCLAPVLQCSPKNLSESKDLLNLKMYLKTIEILLDMWNRLEGLK